MRLCLGGSSRWERHQGEDRQMSTSRLAKRDDTVVCATAPEKLLDMDSIPTTISEVSTDIIDRLGPLRDCPHHWRPQVPPGVLYRGHRFWS
jgi:hypothetical protein